MEQSLLTVFSTLAAWAGGVFAMQALIAFAGEGKKIQTPALAMNAILFVIAMAAGLSTGLSGEGPLGANGSYALGSAGAYAVAALAYFVCLRRSEDGGSVPKWLAGVAFVVGVVFVGACAYSCTMLGMAAGKTELWVANVLTEAAVLGTLSVQAMQAWKMRESKLGSLYAFGAGFARMIVLLSLLTMGQYLVAEEAAEANAVAMPVDILSGELAIVTWIGVVIIGTLAPLGCTAFAIRKGGKAWQPLGSAGVACALVGCVCLRALLWAVA